MPHQPYSWLLPPPPLLLHGSLLFFLLLECGSLTFSLSFVKLLTLCLMTIGVDNVILLLSPLGLLFKNYFSVFLTT